MKMAKAKLVTIDPVHFTTGEWNELYYSSDGLLPETLGHMLGDVKQRPVRRTRGAIRCAVQALLAKSRDMALTGHDATGAAWRRELREIAAKLMELATAGPDGLATCQMCGEPKEQHQASLDSGEPHCRSLQSKAGDRFIQRERMIREMDARVASKG